MTTRRRKKSLKLRALRTHGMGMKKARGSGNRGGKGMAGTGKRADQKKPTIINLYGNDYFGKRGFVRQMTRRYKSINLACLDRKIDNLVKEGKAELKSNIYTIDLKKIKVQKLLGTGKTINKMKITVEMASKGAIEKVKKAGGEVITQAPAKEVAKEAKKQ